MTNDYFVAAMSSLQKYFGKNIEESVLMLYWNILEKYSEEIFGKALINIFHSFHPTATVPFPLIADFMEAMGATGDTRCHAMIATVKRAAEEIGAYRTVDFGDGALHATINRFGGWPTIARWGCTGQWNFQENNFMRAYTAAVENQEMAGPVMGEHEAENIYKNQINFTPEQDKFLLDAKTPVQVNWVGADFSKQIENKYEPIQQIAEFTNSIGRKID
jgi:hypothetical protein